MSALPVLEYIAGIFVFGFIDLIMSDVVMSARYAYFQVVNGTVVESQLAMTDMLAMWFWHGILIAYLVIGGFWLWRQYTEPQSNWG